MIDVSSPDCLTLLELRERLIALAGRRITVQTLGNYIRRGKNGVRLEAVKLGPAWCTTIDCLNRFLAASSQPDQPQPPAPTGPAPLSLKAQWAIKRARELGV